MNTSSPHRWPAEWEHQAATWLAWPHNLDTWPDRFAGVPGTFTRLIETIAKYQPVHVLTGPPEIRRVAEAAVGSLPNVNLHAITTNDVWIRDYGPTFVKRTRDNLLVGIDWKYNAWGGKYTPYEDDAHAANEICRTLGCPRSMSAMHCEGGALEHDGAGTLLTTSSCLLSPARNPGWSRNMIEDELKRQLGVTRIVWVDGGGLDGDDTDGHIDQLARFVTPGIVVAATSSRADDPNREGLLHNVKVLREVVRADGEALQVHLLPTPPPRFVDQVRVPESYCNFIFVNGGLIVPTFRHPETDNAAIQLLSELLPERRVIGLDAYDLIWGLGAFHCASQQQPA